MTRGWDGYTDSELQAIASGRASRYDIDQDRRYERLQGPGGEFGSFLSSAADSLTLGFGDELWGAASGVGSVLSGGDYGTASREATERARQRLRDAWRYHGGAALGGALAGALPMGGGIGLAARGARAASALRNSTALQRVGAAAGAGAAFGGVYGAGSAEGPQTGALGELQSRGMGALGGAGLGALTGGAFQALGTGAGHVWRNMIKPGWAPGERAAQELGRAINRTDIPEEAARRGINPDQEFARRARELQRMEQLSPGSNPMVMDVLGEAGTGLTMAAGTRQSQGRTAMQRALEERNMGARQRVDDMLVRDLGGGQRRNIADNLDDLERIQREEAGPLFEMAHRRTVEAVPRELRDFITFNDRRGARFYEALQTTRETMRRAMGAEATDAQMMRSPMFWHRLLENSSAEVGASIRAARMTPLGAPRGSAIPDMTQDVQRLNAQVRRLLGPEFRQAMDTYAGSARLQEAWELGFQAVRLDGGELALGQFQRRVARMTQSEQDAVRSAAISGLRRELAAADTGTGRSDVLRRIMGNEAKRNTLRAIFGGEAKLNRVMRTLEYERRLFLNYADTNLGRGSPTGDKLMANGQMFAPNEIGGLTGFIRRNLARESRERFDESVANSVLDLMRTPITGPNAPRNITEYARTQGLLSRALREAEQRRLFRERAGPGALQAGAINAVGMSPQEFFGP